MGPQGYWQCPGCGDSVVDEVTICPICYIRAPCRRCKVLEHVNSKLREHIAELEKNQLVWLDYPANTPPGHVACMAKDENGRVWRGEYWPARKMPYWLVDGGDWLEEQPVIVAYAVIPGEGK